jgi:hypothetical protein
VVVPDVFGVLLWQHQVGITHRNTQIACSWAALGDGIRPTVRVNVKEDAADPLRIRDDTTSNWGGEVHLAATDDVDDGRRIDVFSVIVAVLKNVLTVFFEFDHFFRPPDHGSLLVQLIAEGRETAFSSTFEKLKVRFESTYYDNAVPPDQFAQSFVSCIHSIEM